jgi:signal peptidase
VSQHKKKNPVAALCSTLGTVLLIILIVVCLPLTVPRAFGFHIYSVISGSMEPAIPTGSLVYIEEMDPAEVEADEVIAFYAAKDSSSIITHRVVENRVVMGEFITKGDANETQDMNPASYDEFIGKVALSIPVVGRVAQIFTSYAGKIAAASLIVIAILLEIIAVLFEKNETQE